MSGNDRESHSSSADQPRSNPAAPTNRTSNNIFPGTSDTQTQHTDESKPAANTHTDPNPFVAFRRSTDALITHLLSTIPSPSAILAAVSSHFPNVDADRAARKFAESYEKSTDPQRTGAAREPRTKEEREKELEERENRRKEWEEAAERWVHGAVRPSVPLPDPRTFNVNIGLWPGIGDGELWPFGRGAIEPFGGLWPPGKLARARRAWHPSLEWVARDRYSPLQLERRSGTAEKGREWRDAFEDLLASQGEDTEVKAEKRISSSGDSHVFATTNPPLSKDQSSAQTENSEQWLGRLIRRQLVQVHPWQQDLESNEQDIWGWGPWHGHGHGFGRLGRHRHPWGWNQDQDYECCGTSSQLSSDKTKETTGGPSSLPAKSTSSTPSPVAPTLDTARTATEEDERDPDSELEMYERFLSGDSIMSPAGTRSVGTQHSQGEQQKELPSTSLSSYTSTTLSSSSSSSSSPTEDGSLTETPARITGTSTSTSTRILPDGTMTTKTIVRRTFADGREEVEEKSETKKLPPVGTDHGEENRDPASRTSEKNQVKEIDWQNIWDITGTGDDDVRKRERTDEKVQKVQKKSNSWFWSRD